MSEELRKAKQIADFGLRHRTFTIAAEILDSLYVKSLPTIIDPSILFI